MLMLHAITASPGTEHTSETVLCYSQMLQAKLMSLTAQMSKQLEVAPCQLPCVCSRHDKSTNSLMSFES